MLCCLSEVSVCAETGLTVRVHCRCSAAGQGKSMGKKRKGMLRVQQLAACVAWSTGLLWAELGGSPSLRTLCHRRRTVSSPRQAMTHAATTPEPPCLCLHHTAVTLSFLGTICATPAHDEVGVFTAGSLPFSESAVPCEEGLLGK